jgi:hypothetical protein
MSKDKFFHLVSNSNTIYGYLESSRTKRILEKYAQSKNICSVLNGDKSITALLLSEGTRHGIKGHLKDMLQSYESPDIGSTLSHFAR